MLGFCSACGAKIIDIKKKGGKASLRKLENYKEHIVELSNGTIMRVAVCDNCKIELVAGKALDTAKTILSNHKDYWENNRKKKDITDYAGLKIINPNTDLGTFLKKRKDNEIEVINLNEITI